MSYVILAKATCENISSHILGFLDFQDPLSYCFDPDHERECCPFCKMWMSYAEKDQCINIVQKMWNDFSHQEISHMIDRKWKQCDIIRVYKILLPEIPGFFRINLLPCCTPRCAILLGRKCFLTYFQKKI